VDRLCEEGVTEEELAKAKVAYLQSARVRRTSDSSLAAQLVGTIFNERTMQYVADHEAQIEAATIASVNRSIRRFIDMDQLVMAIAGDFASVGVAAATDNTAAADEAGATD
jgi:zinc protease